MAMLSAAARNEAQRLPPGPEQEALIRRARQAQAGTGSVTFRRSASSRAMQSTDSLWGAGTGGRLVAEFSALVQQQGGSENALPDVWATGYAWLLHLRERGKVNISCNGWTAARDHTNKWALAQPGWLQQPDEERQGFADNMAIEVMRLLEASAANREALAKPAKIDPLTGIVWNPVIDQTGSLAEKASEAIVRLFVAAERPAIERLLMQK